MRLFKTTPPQKPEEILVPKTPKKKRQAKKPSVVHPQCKTHTPAEDHLIPTSTEPLKLTLSPTHRPEAKQVPPILEKDVVTTPVELTTPQASESQDADGTTLNFRITNFRITKVRLIYVQK
jgi:hypothetical protein